MDASQTSSVSSLTQGFSVYQPTLGAPLQFLPGVGTQELDDLMNSFIPDPISVQEKRAAISLDFLAYATATGQTFKFYPVYTLNASSVTQSPVTDSLSSFNASPVASSWDFSQVSSQSSTHARQSRKSSPTTRTTDFSHIPGMKIMTKEGVDVTNQASRGSKTKEQRDHAHLMRIIKACDACRRKKIRCDPSHKKRGPTAPSSSQSGAPSSARVSKKTKTPDSRTAATMAAAVTANNPDWEMFQQDYATAHALTVDSWEDLVQFPADEEIDEDYNFFEDPHGYFSPMESSLSSLPTASTNSPDYKGEYGMYAVEGTSTSHALQEAQDGIPAEGVLSHAGHAGTIVDYVDFDLFSPESDFSEDEHMVGLKSSSGSRANVTAGLSNSLGIEPFGSRQSLLGDTLVSTHGQSGQHAPHDSVESMANGGIAAQVSGTYHAHGDTHRYAQSFDPGRGLSDPSPTSSSSAMSSPSSLPSLSSATSSESSTTSVLLGVDTESTGDSRMTGSSLSRRPVSYAVDNMTSQLDTANSGDLDIAARRAQQHVCDQPANTAFGRDVMSAVTIMNAMANIAVAICQSALYWSAISDRDHRDIKSASRRLPKPPSRPMVACM